jgi:hypothetical protein
MAKRPVRFQIVDRNNYHTFLPLLYQVAAALLFGVGLMGLCRNKKEIPELTPFRRVLYS